MKIIVSHDVDHLRVSEHLLRDLIIPKQIVRNHIELLTLKNSLKEYFLRWLEVFHGKMQNIYELHAFNVQNNIPSTWFFGTANGTGLSYAHKAINPFVEHLMNNGAFVELHGICYDDKAIMLEEKKRLELKKKKPVKGIRMHYLKKNHQTLNLLSDCGYLYDSSVYEFKNPYRINKMWEFPIHIMDGYVLENHKKYQSRNIIEAMHFTFKTIEKAVNEKIKYFVIDFHDRYFTPKFRTWMEWYIGTINYLKTNGFEFVNFETAIEELEKECAGS
jgi:hypothetical protein